MDREKALKQLNTPKLGDSLLKADGTPWMASLQHMSPKLNWDDLTQRPATPLGFWLKTDPWDDKVHQLNAKIFAYMNPRDKMPFEVTPIFYKLQRYDAAAAARRWAHGCPGIGHAGPDRRLRPTQRAASGSTTAATRRESAANSASAATDAGTQSAVTLSTRLAISG